MPARRHIEDPQGLTVAVVSDIHVYVRSTTQLHSPSFVHTTVSSDDGLVSPFAGLSELIVQKALRADLLVCCGDMADKGDPTALGYAWAAVHRLAAQLGASVVATAGNHDVDSRGIYCPHDPERELKKLRPIFPIDDYGLANQYWARHFTIIEQPNYRAVLLNTSAYHGRNKEYLKGRVDRDTVAEMRSGLQAGVTRPTQLLVCHHHPYRFSDIDIEDYSEMDGGQLLTDMLSSANVGQWTIIHGHRHVPFLAHAAGGALSPTVFSAGSLAATLQGDAASRARNQFYIIRFSPREAHRLGLGVAAEFDTWNWAVGRGWEVASGTAGLPPHGGFGYQANVPELADHIVRSLRGRQYIDWAAITVRRKALRYLSPDDLMAVRVELESRGYSVTGTRPMIEQVGRP